MGTSYASTDDLSKYPPFGSLTAIEPTRHRGRRAWRCRCECGNECVALASSLVSGGTRSCGCRKKRSSSKNLRKALWVRGHAGLPQLLPAEVRKAVAAEARLRKITRSEVLAEIIVAHYRRKGS